MSAIPNGRIRNLARPLLLALAYSGCGRSRVRDWDRDFDLLRASASGRALARALLLVQIGALKLAVVLGTALVLPLAAAVDRVLNFRLEGRARALARTIGNEQSGGRRVASSAAGLLATASRLLPAAHRSRYAEEYQSELWDLAHAGAGRIRQWRYAFCQLRNTVPMSVALRSPRRRSSVP